MKSSSDKNISRRDAFKQFFKAFDSEKKDKEEQNEVIEKNANLTNMESLDEWEDLLEDD